MSSGYTFSGVAVYIAAFFAAFAFSFWIYYFMQEIPDKYTGVFRRMAAAIAAVFCVLSGLIALARPVISDVALWMESSMTPIIFCLGGILCAFSLIAVCLNRSEFQGLGIPLLISVWSMYTLQFYSGSSCRTPFLFAVLAVCAAYFLCRQLFCRQNYSVSLNIVFNGCLWSCVLIPDIPLECRICAFALNVVFSFDVLAVLQIPQADG